MKNKKIIKKKIPKTKAKKFISKLCKENQPEACKDCLNMRCECYCHKIDIFNDEDYNYDELQ